MIKKITKTINEHAESDRLFWKFSSFIKFILWKIKTKLSWLFFSIKQRIFRRKANLVFKTQLFSCNPNARPELHTIIGHKYVRMYLLSIKSLLRFYNEVAVVVHDDGSLKEKDKQILIEHIQGIKIIDYEYANSRMREILKSHDRCLDERLNNFISRQLFDYLLLSNSGKVVSLDSDTLFFRYPTDFIDWLANDNRQILCNYEDDDTKRELSYDYYPGVNCGFTCFYRDILDLDFVEQILSDIKKTNFCTFQYIISILVKGNSSKYEFLFFDPEKYQTKRFFDSTQPVFKHYLSSSGINKCYPKDSTRVIKELLSI